MKRKIVLIWDWVAGLVVIAIAVAVITLRPFRARQLMSAHLHFLPTSIDAETPCDQRINRTFRIPRILKILDDIILLETGQSSL